MSTARAHPCPSCAASTAAGDRFCEACGHRLAACPHWLSSTIADGHCAGCGSSQFGAEGYCEQCGQRRAVGQDHAELDLGALAGATDRGHHRHRNEDALAIARLGGTSVAVLCDGVSSCTRADAASHAAADTGISALLDALAAGVPPTGATEAGTRAAAAAVAGVAGPQIGPSPPSCTYVSAVVTPTQVIVGWVGDSRAYWLAADPAESTCLTTDDSLAGQLAAAASRAGAQHAALADPRALALTRWLGADSADKDPKITVYAPTGPGLVLVCTDGLHKYLPEPDRLAATAAATPDDPAATARALTQLALDAGGQDNIAVAVLAFPPNDYPQVAGGPTA